MHHSTMNVRLTLTLFISLTFLIINEAKRDFATDLKKQIPKIKDGITVAECKMIGKEIKTLEKLWVKKQRKEFLKEYDQLWDRYEEIEDEIDDCNSLIYDDIWYNDQCDICYEEYYDDYYYPGKCPPP